ncbi:MAG: hypothetical protein Q7J59_02005 [Elusimicrobiota bacterium]|nr:hypothetical protein [Elusimicrobiota bacterium]
MINRRFAVLTLAVICILNGSGCVRSDQAWKAGRKKPAWVSKPPEKPGYYYYVGISQHQEDRGVALQKALEEAMKQVLTTIGITVGTQMRLDKEIRGNEAITKMLDKYRESGQAKVQGHKIDDSFTEEYLDGGRRFCDFYLLLRYSESEIKKERQRIQDQQAQNRLEADRKMRESDALLKEGKILASFEEDARMFTMLADQPGISQYSLLLNRIKKLLNSLEAEVASAQGKKPSVRLIAKMDGKRKAVSGVRMLASFDTGEGEVDSPKSTDEDGLAVFPIAKIKFAGGITRLKIRPMAEQFTVPLQNAYMDDSDFQFIEGILKGLEVSLTLKAADFGGSKFAMVVWDDKGKRETSFETALAKQLTAAGISVRAFSDIAQGVSFDNFENEEFYGFLTAQGMDNLIVGRVKVIDNGDVYNLKSVTSQADMKVVELKTRKLLAAFEKSKTGVQINFERAKSKTSKELVEEIAPELVDIAGVQ